MNHDGQFTASDLWPMVQHVFFLPGDFAIYAGMHTRVGKLLELSERLYGGLISGIVSAFAWIIVICVVICVVLGIRGAILVSREVHRSERLD